LSKVAQHRPASSRLRAARWLAGLLAVGLSLLAAALAAAQPGPGGSSGPAPAREDPVGSAQRLFDAGRFAEGVDLLNDACRRMRRSHGDYARLLSKLAFFYEHYVGDDRRVRGYLREIDKLDLPPDHAARLDARKTRARVDARAARYAELDPILARARFATRERHELDRRVAELSALVETQPDYPRLAAVHHYLGQTYLDRGEHRRAYRAFQRATELRPAIGFMLPTEKRMSRAFELWVRRDLALGAWAVLGALGLVVAVLFVAARPWRYLRLWHALVLLSLAALWWLALRSSVLVLADSLSAEGEPFASPVYFYTAVGSPKSQALEALFRYGLIGLGGAFAMAVVTARFRPRLTWTFVNAAASVLLFAALMTQFYLRHGSDDFRRAAEGRFPYLRGTVYYPLSEDQDPFILTEPTSYCGFQPKIQNMDESRVRKWFERYAAVCSQRGGSP